MVNYQFWQTCFSWWMNDTRIRGHTAKIAKNRRRLFGQETTASLSELSTDGTVSISVLLILVPSTPSRLVLTDDTMWPQKVKVMTQYLWSLMSQKLCETDGWFKLTTYRKPYITKPMVTWPMMSLDANGDSLRLGGLLGTNNGCKFLANEG